METGWPTDLGKAQHLAALLKEELSSHYYSVLWFHISSMLLYSPPPIF